MHQVQVRQIIIFIILLSRALREVEFSHKAYDYLENLIILETVDQVVVLFR